MRILQVNDINEVGENFSKELIKRGHAISFYKPDREGGFAPLPIKLALMPKRLFDLRHVIKKLHTEKFDIMHIHWASYGLIGLASNIPFIVECHGTDVRYRVRKNIFYRALLRFIFHKASAVICITPDLLPVVRSIYPEVLFLPGPVDTDVFVPSNRENAPSRSFMTVLLFARLERVKGCEIALRGILQFAQRHPEVQIKLLEWGKEKEYYKQLYENRFEFIPRVAPEMVNALLQTADVIIGQVALGAIGLSELQAMSCAKPVIASFLYNDAYPAAPPLYQAATAQEIDDRLENLYQHPEEGVELGKKAREWVINNHGIQVLGSRIEAVYQTIVNDSLSMQKTK